MVTHTFLIDFYSTNSKWINKASILEFLDFWLTYHDPSSFVGIKLLRQISVAYRVSKRTRKIYYEGNFTEDLTINHFFQFSNMGCRLSKRKFQQCDLIDPDTIPKFLLLRQNIFSIIIHYLIITHQHFLSY